MGFKEMAEREAEMRRTDYILEKKVNLVSQTEDLCSSIYSTFEKLHNDFPNSNLSNLYKAYKDKINDLKEVLKENNLFNDEIDSGLQMILDHSKSLDYSLYSRDINNLKKLMRGLVD